uniref:Uncharacterized protein n=1 Tax=Guillardia theta TaxID=55529 RepID=A0A7S4NKC8_GUITH|mmetsp:Transcript_23267/g.75663  ORF Transcript_23267/g.75663 Transcript_23267/m.75663 type:complete len:407 (+) Transcript_23267:65-1285(+)
MSNREKLARQSFQDLFPILSMDERQSLVQMFEKNSNRTLTDDSEIPRKIHQLALAKGRTDIATSIANAFPAVKSFATPQLYGQAAPQPQRSSIMPAQQYRQTPGAAPVQPMASGHALGFQQSQGAMQGGGYQPPTNLGQQMHHGLQPYQQQSVTSAASSTLPAAGLPHTTGLTHQGHTDTSIPANQEAGKADDANAGKKDKENEAENAAKKAKEATKEEFNTDILNNMDLEREQAVLESVYQYKPSTKFLCNDVPFLNYEKVDGDRSGPLINRMKQIVGGHEQAIQQVENSAIDLLSVACEMHIRTMCHRLFDLYQHRKGRHTPTLHFHQEPEGDIEPGCHANWEEQVKERRGVKAAAQHDGSAMEGAGGEAAGGEERSGRRSIDLLDILYVLEREVHSSPPRLLL